MSWSVWGPERACEWIMVPAAHDDKYSRGVLGVVTGSEQYPGAALLGVEAAYRTGVGMVRYYGPASVHPLLLARRPEVVIESGRVQAWLLGSGMDGSHAAGETSLADAWRSEQPLVLDAGALSLLGQPGRGHAPVVITPHYRELAAALVDGGHTTSAEEIAADPGCWAERAADLLGVTVLLKGTVSHIASPSGVRIMTPAATSWLATAGTGDVLAGVLGALLATHADAIAAAPENLAPLAATAVLLHSTAARLASVGGPIAALDVAGALPAAVAEILATPVPGASALGA